MPKFAGHNIPTPVLVVVSLAVAYGIYDGFKPSASSGATTKTRSRRSSSKSTTAANSQYTKDDYEAKFAVYSKPARNVFSPLVKKTTQDARAMAAVGAGVLPAFLTGGEANWTYSGYAAVNGVRQGLLENTSSFESVFLVEGQKWRSLTVRKISSEQMVVAGPSGADITIPIGDNATEQSTVPGVTAPNGVAPVSPGAALSGPIGAVAAGPNPTDLRVEPDQGQNSQRDNGFSRRSRRRRGN